MALFREPLNNGKMWKKVRIGDITENLDSKRIPVSAKERKNGKYPYYGASGIVDYVSDYLFDENLLLVSEDGANLLSRTTPIAFSVSGKCWVNNHAHVLRFFSYSTQVYIEYYLAFCDISNMITGTAQPKFTQSRLSSLLVDYPELVLQDEFAIFVKEKNKLKFIGIYML